VNRDLLNKIRGNTQKNKSEGFKKIQNRARAGVSAVVGVAVETLKGSTTICIEAAPHIRLLK